jgi:hypothetical protein
LRGETLCSGDVVGLLLLLVVGKLGTEPGFLPLGDRRIGLQHFDILLGLGELGLELQGLGFIDCPIELEQRLALLHLFSFFHEHGGDHGRVG